MSDSADCRLGEVVGARIGPAALAADADVLIEFIDSQVVVVHKPAA